MPSGHRTSIHLPVLLLALVAPGLAPAGDEVAEVAEILLSRQLLERAGIDVGDVIDLSTDRSGADARRFRVVGVYEPTPDPFRLTSKRHEARLHLPDLIDMVASPGDPASFEAVDRVNLALEHGADAVTFSRDLRSRLPGIQVRPTARAGDSNVFLVLERFHVAVAVVTVLGSTAFLLALMVMRVDQRRETAGILRLIGVSRGRILLEVFVEGTCIALAGALFGVLFAGAVQGLFNAFFQWHYDTALVFVRVTPALAARCVAVAIPLGVLAGLVASWTLLRRDILALLRR